MQGCISRESDSIDLLSKEVAEMQKCQLQAENLNFYLHKYRADKVINKYIDRVSSLSEPKQRQFVKERSRYAFVLSDYEMQVGNQDEAICVMDELASDNTLNFIVDTTLWLDYLCHQAKVNFKPYNLDKNKKCILKGYDSLIQSYIIASRHKFDAHKGISMMLMSRYLLNDSVFSLVKDFDTAFLRYVNEDGVNDTLLAGNLAERALEIFRTNGDSYLTAEALRNLASCYFVIGDAVRSIEYLNMATAIPVADSVPALEANINQQLSMAFAALDDKHNSDSYRNKYLDIQDSTRQDRQFEARAEELRESTMRIWVMSGIMLAAFILLCVLTAVLVRLRRRRLAHSAVQDDDIVQQKEQIAVMRLKCSDMLRLAIEQKARISIVNAMLPLIDRMRIAVEKGQLDYARELACAIDAQNASLTQWIKLRQGMIAPQITSFPVQEIFDIVGQMRGNLEANGINVSVSETDACVKGDKILTLFIINTLIDNARKAFDGANGDIGVDCVINKDAGYAEISVSDNGYGMTSDQIAKLFDYKTTIVDDGTTNGKSHGFGFQNCLGIINRYRKLSSAFTVCCMEVESVVGKGTRVFFRLPTAMKMLAFVFMMLMSDSMSAGNIDALADSLYECNVAGRYHDAMMYADSCNAMISADSTVAEEIQLSVYNETAVAALALHEWSKYLFYNYKYSQYYKYCTTDKTLPDYCRRMEEGKLIANVAMLVAIGLLLLIFPIFWYTYLRHIVRQKKETEEYRIQLQEQLRMLGNKHSALHVANNIIANQLSTVKHETMYYPSRIVQLIDASVNDAAVEGQLAEVVNYYRELYSMLGIHTLNSQAQAYAFPVGRHRLSVLLPCSGDVWVYCNEELMQYLLVLLKRHNHRVCPSCSVTGDDDMYVHLSFCLDQPDIAEADCEQLFTLSTISFDFLVIRQILRETAEATLRYSCGASAECKDGKLFICITLPKYDKEEVE